MPFAATLLLLCLAMPAAAEAIHHETLTFTGTSETANGQDNQSWRAWFDVPIEQAAARMTDWSRAKDFLDKATGFELQANAERSARFVIEREGPFFTTQRVLFEATATQNGPRTVVRWVQIEGPAKSIERTWVLTPVAGGTLFEHETRVVLPFAPPAALLELREAPAKVLARQVEMIRQEVGARVSKSTPP